MMDDVKNLNSLSKGRAAIYARMSTEEQDLSIDTQIDEFHKYCEQNNLTIVKEYSDHGKSGVLAKGRDAFLQLIEDAKTGNVDFEYLLIYAIHRGHSFNLTR